MKSLNQIWVFAILAIPAAAHSAEWQAGSTNRSPVCRALGHLLQLPANVPLQRNGSLEVSIRFAGSPLRPVHFSTETSDNAPSPQEVKATLSAAGQSENLQPIPAGSADIDIPAVHMPDGPLASVPVEIYRYPYRLIKQTLFYHIAVARGFVKGLSLSMPESASYVVLYQGRPYSLFTDYTVKLEELTWSESEGLVHTPVCLFTKRPGRRAD